MNDFEAFIWAVSTEYTWFDPMVIMTVIALEGRSAVTTTQWRAELVQKLDKWTKALEGQLLEGESLDKIPVLNPGATLAIARGFESRFRVLRSGAAGAQVQYERPVWRKTRKGVRQTNHLFGDQNEDGFVLNAEYELTVLDAMRNFNDPRFKKINQ